MRKTRIIITVVLMLTIFGCSPKVPAPQAEPVEVPLTIPPQQYEEPVQPVITPKLNPVTGLPYHSERPTVLAVMVENTPQARPQSGLHKAEVVYEMLAEGGITRFMAIYHENEATVVGPVRSARTYFVAMVREWNAGYAHAGGNEDALALLRKWGIQDLDEIYRYSEPYWRDSSRAAPHNLYTNTEKLRGYFNKPGRLRSWPFNEVLSSGGNQQSVVIPYNSFTYSTYRFNPATGTYLRFIGSQPHVDKETGVQLEAANVILQYAIHKPGGVEPGSIDITLTGRGKAEYMREGKKYTGYWEKKGPDEETKFYLDNGSLFTLRPGTTWIQVVPTTIKPTYQ